MGLVKAIGNSHKIAVPNASVENIHAFSQDITQISLVICTLTITILTCFQNTFWKKYMSFPHQCRVYSEYDLLWSVKTE